MPRGERGLKLGSAGASSGGPRGKATPQPGKSNTSGKGKTKSSPSTGNKKATIAATHEIVGSEVAIQKSEEVSASVRSLFLKSVKKFKKMDMSHTHGQTWQSVLDLIYMDTTVYDSKTLFWNPRRGAGSLITACAQSLGLPWGNVEDMTRQGRKGPIPFADTLQVLNDLGYTIQVDTLAGRSAITLEPAESLGKIHLLTDSLGSGYGEWFSFKLKSTDEYVDAIGECRGIYDRIAAKDEAVPSDDGDFLTNFFVTDRLRPSIMPEDDQLDLLVRWRLPKRITTLDPPCDTVWANHRYTMSCDADSMQLVTSKSIQSSWRSMGFINSTTGRYQMPTTPRRNTLLYHALQLNTSGFDFSYATHEQSYVDLKSQLLRFRYIFLDEGRFFLMFMVLMSVVLVFTILTNALAYKYYHLGDKLWDSIPPWWILAIMMFPGPCGEAIALTYSVISFVGFELLGFILTGVILTTVLVLYVKSFKRGIVSILEPLPKQKVQLYTRWEFVSFYDWIKKDLDDRIKRWQLGDAPVDPELVVYRVSREKPKLFTGMFSGLMHFLATVESVVTDYAVPLKNVTVLASGATFLAAPLARYSEWGSVNVVVSRRAIADCISMYNSDSGLSRADRHKRVTQALDRMAHIEVPRHLASEQGLTVLENTRDFVVQWMASQEGEGLDGDRKYFR